MDAKLIWQTLGDAQMPLPLPIMIVDWVSWPNLHTVEGMNRPLLMASVMVAWSCALYEKGYILFKLSWNRNFEWKKSKYPPEVRELEYLRPPGTKPVVLHFKIC
jgi:hypothetical protein